MIFPLIPVSACRRIGAALVFALLIMGVPGTANAYVVRPGDTLSGIAQRNGVSTSTLASANDIDDPHRIRHGQTLRIPGAGSGTTHVVAPGETLSEIAARYGVSTSALAAANGIDDPNQVRSGESLAVGGGGGENGVHAKPSDADVRRHISVAAANHGWRPAIPLGLALQESGWNNNVVSAAGARGIMQVLPSTGEWVGRVLLGRSLDLGDPADNAAAGVAYLDYLYNLYDHDLEVALAAYYEGPGNVSRRGVSDGGRRYAANVIALADRYR